MIPESQSRPQLRAGCRISTNAGQEDTLLIPEGLIKMKGPGRAILELCDGERTFAEIVEALQSVYPTAPAEQIMRDAGSYLERLSDRGAVEY